MGEWNFPSGQFWHSTNAVQAHIIMIVTRRTLNGPHKVLLAAKYVTWLFKLVVREDFEKILIGWSIEKNCSLEKYTDISSVVILFGKTLIILFQ